MSESEFNLTKIYKPFSNNFEKLEIFKYIKVILAKDVKFLYLAALYSILISVFTLAVPISVQLLINSVAFITMVQPILILGIVLFIFLVFSGLLNIFQTYLVEIFHRRFFARMSAEISLNLIRSDFNAIEQSNQTELVNRFFDVKTVQKIMPRFITETSSLILQIIFGLILVTFYHPALLLFNIFIIAVIYIIWVAFYKQATISAFYESRRKYDMAAWLEELGRNSDSFRSEVAQKYSRLKVNFLTNQYLKERKKHFYYLFRQIIALFGLYAIANSILLVFGGYLVINNKLSLGQLVASELVLSAILYRISRFGKDFENFYDLAAACEKLSQFYNIPKLEDKKLKISDEEIKINFSSIHTEFCNQDYFVNMEFEHNKSYLIATNSSITQKLIINLLKGYHIPTSGKVMLNDLDINKININNLHSKITTIDNSLFIEGTIREYLTIDVVECEENLENLLDVLGILPFMKKLGLDMDSRIVPSGWPFLDNEKVMLKIAKAILDNPKIIILTEIFDTIKYADKKRILEFLNNKTEATILCFANMRYDTIKFDQYLYVDNNEAKIFNKSVDLVNYERQEVEHV